MLGKFGKPMVPQVTILMGVYNGADFLPAQLESIAAQSHQNWHFICSDDHSTDESRAVIADFATRNPDKVTYKTGPGKGFATNYMSLISTTHSDSGYLCFADQDDIWKPEKIARALAVLGTADAPPRLYCGRRSHWYSATGHCATSPEMHRPFELRNALIENVASGNTILLNPAASALARTAAERTPSVYAHDWWLYILITACGGEVRFDNGPPMVRYRQHPGNLIGAGDSLHAQLRRKIEVLQGAFSRRLASNLSALANINDLLTPNARTLCAEFAAARTATPLNRLSQLRRIAPYRQHRLGTLGFWGAASLGCI